MKNMHILLASMMTICSAAAMGHGNAERGKEVVTKIIEATGPNATIWGKIKATMKPGKEALSHGVAFVKEVASDVTVKKIPAVYQSFMGLDPMKKAAVVAGTVIAGYILVKVIAYGFSETEEVEE